MKNFLNYLSKVTISIFILILFVGCATIMGKSSPESLNIRSTPEQASVTITDEIGNKIFEGKTPTTIMLEKKKGYFSGKKYYVKIYKDGFNEQIATVDTKITGWYFGNIIFGGLIGILIVDPATGGMWTLDTNEINASLVNSQKVSKTDSMKLEIALLEDVPITLRHRLVQFTP